MKRGQQGAGAGETRRGFIKKTAASAVALSGVRFLSPAALFAIRRLGAFPT